MGYKNLKCCIRIIVSYVLLIVSLIESSQFGDLNPKSLQ